MARKAPDKAHREGITVIELMDCPSSNPHFPSIVDIQCGEKAILL